MKRHLNRLSFSTVSDSFDPRIYFSRARDFVTVHWLNCLVVALITLVGSTYAFQLSTTIPAEFLDQDRQQANVWFQADIIRVMDNMTERWSDHYRTKVHPLFSLIAYPPTYILHNLGFSALTAIRLVTSLMAGLWLGTLCSVLLLMGLRRLDAVIFACLASVTASFIFFATVPETFLLGAISITAVLLLSLCALNTTVSRGWQTAVNAFSMSATITNWMAGILSAFVLNDRRRAIRICCDGFLIVIILWGIEKLVFPSAGFFLANGDEAKYALMTTSAGPIERMVSFFLYSVVMPGISVLKSSYNESWPLLSIEHSPLSSYSAIGVVAVLLWLSLLAIGVVSAWRSDYKRKFFFVAGGLIFGQLMLHVVYGDEIFLYSFHWLPLFIVIAAAGTLTPYRKVVLVIATILIVLAAGNNLCRFAEAVETLEVFRLSGDAEPTGSERGKLLSAMKQNPSGDWPRGEAHVVLAATGSDLASKGYHEPGGSFSPGFPSFGVSFLVFDERDNFITSSNQIPIDEIEQRIVGDTSERGYSIHTMTPYYSAEWSVIEDNRWRLKFQGNPDANLQFALRISSSGPSGNHLVSLKQDGSRMLINEVWKMVFREYPGKIRFIAEHLPPSLTGASFDTFSSTPSGFGATLVEFDSGRRYEVEIVRTAGSNDATGYRKPTDAITIDVPAGEFSESLFAQIAHLKMGLVNNETRPGDPGNYPLEWLRDGAFTLFALARAGELDLVRRLAPSFAEQDFFGGFGAEADGPGLAIWALVEAASQLKDPAFDNWLWPHVERKVNIIIEMLDSVGPSHKVFSGPIVPALRQREYAYLSRISERPRRGLITGKMDNHHPIFYVNAVSYAGLLNASLLAKKLGHIEVASVWQRRAGKLRTSWLSALETHQDRTNPRTLISGIWPSQIVGNQDSVYRRLLEDNWRKRRTDSGDFKRLPKWTYFDIAEAHQWLLLGEVDRMWSTVDWFWEHQVSPGLYTWAEGDDEENTFGLWNDVRGWVQPRHVTPHYWTAAEMLLLQFDVLAYSANGVDCDNQEIVLGGGVPQEWISQNIEVRGLRLSCGRLDWTWKGSQFEVFWEGSSRPLFLPGPSFPDGVVVVVSER